MDSYARKARLYPATCVLLPLSVLAVLLFAIPQWWTGIVGILIAAGLHVPVMFAVRDLGTRAQPGLWSSWGGTPTTVRMRWASADNKLLHARRLDDVGRATGLTMPSEAAERDNAEDADAAYDAASKLLREKTRSGNDFPLVKEEVTNYGYRRNLYGCKPVGIAVTGLAFVIELTLAVLSFLNIVEVSAPLMIVGSALSVVWGLWWILAVTPDYVRRDANRYADALIASAGSISDSSS